MQKQPKKPKKNQKILQNLIYLTITIIIFASLILLGNGVSQDNENRPQFSDLITNIRNNRVSEIEVSEDKEQIVAKIYEDQTKNRDNTTTIVYPNIDKSKTVLENINNALGESKVEIGNEEGDIIYSEKPRSLASVLLDNSLFNFLLQILIFGAIAVFIIRKLGEVNSKSISFGSSRAKSFDEIDQKDKITFADVAGNEEAKQELTEVVDFLKRPGEYINMGAKIPKGVLLIGQPGNGKTLMAKAVAGEADVPFFFVSGSEFVEMFVGVGAGRVRDLFRKAQKKAPCVVFIDEIDAVGRQRGAGLGGGNDEREQTLNQILVEMDGFEPTSSVIVLAATNRPDVLDPALLRPGRFDRQVTVTSPDRKEREEILKVHARNKKLSKDADLGIVAKRTAGFSGADLANVLNEAAILTVREKKQTISNDILREAVEKVVLGPSLKTKVITEDQKKLTAYHEAGHALTSTIIPEAHKVQKITIIPRGKAGGYTFHDQGEQDPMTRTKSEFLADITVLFGGYTVEEVVFGEVSTGASNDLAKASEIARNMVTKFGMSDLGPVSFDENKGLSFLGKDMVEGKQYSEEVAGKIDIEVSKILQSCYERCKSIVVKYRKELDEIALALLDKEVIEYEEFSILTQHIQNAG